LQNQANLFVIGWRAQRRIWIHEGVLLANLLHRRSDSQLRTIRICATANRPACYAATAMPGYSSTRTWAGSL
jgi:hypothetical protein